MKKRLIKKTAKRFLADRTYLPFGTREEEVWGYNDGSPAVVKTIARFPWKVHREIIRQAKAERVCHWDSPLVLSIDDSELREYEEKHNPPHCW